MSNSGYVIKVSKTERSWSAVEGQFSPKSPSMPIEDRTLRDSIEYLDHKRIRSLNAID